MIWRRAVSKGYAALVVAGLGFSWAAIGSAYAADLGKDCCADLEERIAELEATTARKGNRKVSVTVSGWVNEAVFWWDDGTEHNVYVGTNLIEQSRFRFVGEAKIDKDWSAGYVLEIGVVGTPSNQWNQFSDESANNNPINGVHMPIVRKSNWYIKNKTFGQIAIGLNGTATYHLLDDADPTLTRNVDDAEGAAIYMSLFQIRSGGNFVNGLRWTDVLRGFNNSTPGDSARRQVIRYDSPTIHGFTLSAAWGEDDLWDAALTFKHDIGDFSVVARAGYGASTDPGFTSGPRGFTYVIGGTPCISGTSTATSLPNFDCTWEAAGATVMHNPTGLFVFGGWGRQTIGTGHVFPPGTIIEPDSTVWFVQPGIERKWCSLGKTNIFAEYRRDDPGSNPGKTVSGNVNFLQAGAIQNFENADMSLYIVYQHAGGDVIGNAATAASGAPIGKTEIDGFQEVITGAKINF